MKVLFIGNSHTYFNDMPQTFADMCCKWADEKTEVFMLAYSWKDLEWHASTEYFTVRFNILYGNYDYCVVQQGAHPFPGEKTTLKNVQIIAGLCEKAGTKLLVTETWAEKDHPEHQKELSRANLLVAEKTGAGIVPAGTVWEKIRKNHPGIDLFWKDGEHAGPYGDLLIAVCLYKMTAGKSGREPDPDFIIRDFVKDMKLDFHHPRVIEETDKIETAADREKARIIFETAGEICRCASGQNA